MAIWNPWHGCKKLSPGCANCYVYRRDESIGKDASIVSKTGDYDLPLKRNRKKEYKLSADDGVVYTCMTSDFFLEEADEWRQGCWDMIRERKDLSFYIITKRIDRFEQCMPPDWGDGWEHVTICSTCENQDRADYRLPILLELPIRHRRIVSEPMLEEIHFEKYLATGLIEQVTCGGESGPNARPCDFRWIQEVRRECIRQGVTFYFKQTGAVFVMNGKTYHIDRKDQMSQARKSGLSYTPGTGAADEVADQLPRRECGPAGESGGRKASYRYIVFDVETPNFRNDRMSAIGISVIEDGVITRELFSYIDPETHFDAFNTQLTGIDEEVVLGKPTFPEIWKEIEPIMSSGILVAHNAVFDLGVLKACLTHYEIKWKPSVKYACTVRIGRKLLPAMKHNLNVMCDYYGIALDHHKADSDSHACAEILLRYFEAGVDEKSIIRTYVF